MPVKSFSAILDEIPHVPGFLVKQTAGICQRLSRVGGGRGEAADGRVAIRMIDADFQGAVAAHGIACDKIVLPLI